MDKKKVAVFTGAGISAESGIATFREAGGLWEKYRIEDVATPEAWSRNPHLVLDFYNQRRVQLSQAQPNKAHYGLVELEQYFDMQIITQNVDDLHERAGSSRIIHLHGELMKVRSTGPGQEVFTLSNNKLELHESDRCPKGFPLRPHIVWFGELVPEIDHAAHIISEADILIIIGTSLQVYPAAGLVHYSKPQVPIFIVDPHEINITSGRVTHIKQKASVGITELIKILLTLKG